MSAAIFWTVYLTGFLLTYRRQYLAADRYHRREWPTLSVGGSDRSEFKMFAAFTALGWPLTWVVLGFFKALGFVTPETDSERADRLAEREREVARRERRIRDLEREAGLG